MAAILIIDDEAPVRASMRDMLETAGGHSVRAVSSGPEAIASLQQAPTPDVIITDLLLPEMDGIDIIRAIRAADQVTPIIAVSGDPQMDRRGDNFVSAKTAGATATLVKPFRASVLCNLVNDVLRQHRPKPASEAAQPDPGTGAARSKGPRPD